MALVFIPEMNMKTRIFVDILFSLTYVYSVPVDSDSHNKSSIATLRVSTSNPAANGDFDGSQGQLVLTGHSSLLLDATGGTYKASSLDSCQSKSGQVSLQCADGCSFETLQEFRIAQLPCPGGSQLVRVINIRPPPRVAAIGPGGLGLTMTYDTDFKGMSFQNELHTPIGMSIAYSPSDSFWEDEVLSMKDVPDLSAANDAMLGSFRDRFKAWVDKIRKVDINACKHVSFQQHASVPIDYSSTQNRCENKHAKVNYGMAGHGLLTLGAGVSTKMTFGIKIIGTLVPFKMHDALFYAKAGDTEIKATVDMDFGVTVKVDKIFELFAIPMTPFQVPGIVAIGPSFGARLTNHMDISLDVKASIEWSHTIPSQDGLVGIKSDSDDMAADVDNERIAKANVSRPEVNLGEGIQISGDWTLAISPTIDFGINILEGSFEIALGIQYDNIIGMKADASTWGSPDNEGYCVAIYGQVGGSLYRDVGKDKSHNLVAISSPGKVFDTEGSCKNTEVPKIPASFTIDDKQRREHRKKTTCISVDRNGQLTPSFKDVADS